MALHPVRKATLDIPVTRLEIAVRGQRYGYRLLAEAMAEPPAAVAAHLGAARGRRCSLSSGRPGKGRCR
ncbi:GntR family transcriptional regulator, histidine utilization repressor [Gemmobacter aquatilis]|uniref:GntR family transcriptional regulator, histidine utilization repressor n=1 Tax=Gemmobacter aquatilis TaxID=933059 RepID=A0A1H8FN59_9RHOB|nr:hypothetical protein [Gemmobacter aquatilis]SEN33143.1 GntR family transcriptional regulator, histidine utilization repressor [Gemmobacter aquatilis]